MNIMHYNTNTTQKYSIERVNTMKTFKKIALFAICLTLVLTCVCACAEKPATEDTKLVMATNANFPPYEFKGDNGGYEGIDIEIAGKIADKLGKELEIMDVEFGTIVGGVETGKYDIGMAGMTVTPEREESVNFSKSYATGVQVVIVKKDSEIKSIDDIATKAKMIGVQQDTTGDIYASDDVENGGYGADKVTSYKNGADAVQALVSGKIDCVIIDNEPAKAFVKENEGLEILATEWLVEDYAIAINKNDTKLLEDINKALDELTADGTIKTIVDKYIPAE